MMEHKSKVNRYQATFAVDIYDADGGQKTLNFSLSGRGPETMGQLGDYVKTAVDEYISSLRNAGDRETIQALMAELTKLRAEVARLGDTNGNARHLPANSGQRSEINVGTRKENTGADRVQAKRGVKPALPE